MDSNKNYNEYIALQSKTAKRIKELEKLVDAKTITNGQYSELLDLYYSSPCPSKNK